MRNTARDSLIGLTAIVGILLLSWMLMSFGELSGIGREYQRLVIRTPSARGVSPVAPVSLNGVRIGDVTGIEIAPDGSGEALINVRYFEEVKIPADFTLFLDAGFIGSASLDFVSGPGPHIEFVAGEGEEYRRDVASLMDTLTDQVVSKLDTLDETAERINTLADTYTDVGQRLAGVIDSDDPEAQDLSTLVTRIDEVLTTTEALLGEDELLADIRDSLTKWRDAAESITSETERIGARTDETFAKLDSAVVSIDQAAMEARDIGARINRGEGTLGQLSTNEDLYRSLDASIKQLQALIKEGQLLIEKFRDEGVPINL
ncbi:MAG: hypothetical protein Phyf2KO_04920 [Phycisphaerales bacterium]